MSISLPNNPLESTDFFVNRHIGPGEAETSEMLAAIGASSLEELINETVPAAIRLKKSLNLPPRLSEYEYLRMLKGKADKNKVFKSYIGMGYYETAVPAVIQRNSLENPGWYTQYTPYQAESAQGRLEALLYYQTLVADLTGLELANASLLDEGTAAAEAMFMLFQYRNRKVRKEEDMLRRFFVSEKCFPQTIDIIKTRAIPMGIEVVVGSHKNYSPDDQTFAILLQYPDGDGKVEDYSELITRCKSVECYTILAADLLSLTLLASPADMGADVAVGNTQRFGVPMGFGGPHAAYFATHDEFKRNIPGRIIGVSVDRDGNPALRMALQTREQHIKREKATSNICTAQALLAIMAGMYGVYHGPKGLKAIAGRIHFMAGLLAKSLSELGFSEQNKTIFDTIKVKSEAVESQKIKTLAEKKGVNFRYFADGSIGISIGETTSAEDLETVGQIFAEAAGKTWNAGNFTQTQAKASDFTISNARTSGYLSHPIFNRYHNETELMRYIKRLENRDLSLTTSMIPLGSCTMKLNAATELYPVSWPEFNAIHPFAPVDQTTGYLEIVDELESYLSEITGFTATSLQPNSGAQGEYAGLMVIRAYHLDRGDTHRNVVLIPSSAHGTNPASAVMAAMEVIVVKCDEMGNIEVSDLREKAEANKEKLSCLMVTYPSTHGVFEESIIEICKIVHENGGLVYMDGANMNAQVGLTSPANIGADVCHLNLHKTFAIPHGGGGPGMGPICVNDKLAPYLPGHAVVKTGGKKAITAVSSAPWGSASILLISYGYIRMLGAKGVVDATRYAILNANYLKTRLAEHYPILYVGKNGRVAHEFIMDFRQFKAGGIEVEDVAKRLMDFSFHAPTVSFPVAGTLMIEPTESEPKAELDRFIEAMICIRGEIEGVVCGMDDAHDNVLKNAPHTIGQATNSKWEHTYSREKATFPVPGLYNGKFWPAVSRIDNTYGDRNLVCTCPPIEAYEKNLVD